MGFVEINSVLGKGAFFNYVDKILAFFDHLHTGLTFVKEFLYCYYKAMLTFPVPPT